MKLKVQTIKVFSYSKQKNQTKNKENNTRQNRQLKVERGRGVKQTAKKAEIAPTRVGWSGKKNATLASPFPTLPTVHTPHFFVSAFFPLFFLFLFICFIFLAKLIKNLQPTCLHYYNDTRGTVSSVN